MFDSKRRRYFANGNINIRLLNPGNGSVLTYRLEWDIMHHLNLVFPQDEPKAAFKHPGFGRVIAPRKELIEDACDFLDDEFLEDELLIVEESAGFDEDCEEKFDFVILPVSIFRKHLSLWVSEIDMVRLEPRIEEMKTRAIEVERMFADARMYDNGGEFPAYEEDGTEPLSGRSWSDLGEEFWGSAAGDFIRSERENSGSSRSSMATRATAFGAGAVGGYQVARGSAAARTEEREAERRQNRAISIALNIKIKSNLLATARDEYARRKLEAEIRSLEAELASLR